MIGKKHEGSRVVPIHEVKDILKEREADGELTYEQTLTKEHVKKFSKLTKASGKKFMDEVSKLVEDERLAVKIADILPADTERLKLLIPKGTKIEDGRLDEILKLVRKYRK